MEYEIIIGIAGIALGLVFSSSYWKLKIKNIATIIRKIIPGNELEPILGNMLIELGEELKKNSISADDAFKKLNIIMDPKSYKNLKNK